MCVDVTRQYGVTGANALIDPMYTFATRQVVINAVLVSRGLLTLSRHIITYRQLVIHYPHGASRLHDEGLGKAADNGGKSLKRKYKNGDADY